MLKSVAKKRKSALDSVLLGYFLATAKSSQYIANLDENSCFTVASSFGNCGPCGGPSLRWRCSLEVLEPRRNRAGGMLLQV